MQDIIIFDALNAIVYFFGKREQDIALGVDRLSIGQLTDKPTTAPRGCLTLHSNQIHNLKFNIIVNFNLDSKSFSKICPGAAGRREAILENSELYDLINDPKSNLQHQLYKTTLRFEVLREAIIDFAKSTSEAIAELINPILSFINEYKEVLCLGAKENPHVAYLARHAKKYRQRKKNLNRLYLIGLEIQKQNSHLK